MAMVYLMAPGAGDPIAVELQRVDGAGGETYVVSFGESRYEVELDSDGAGGGWLRIQGRILAFHSHRNGDQLDLWIDGRTWSFACIDRAARRARGDATAAVQKALTAPMPGTVLKIHVAAGDGFEAHQPLIVMESMKMELTLSAPHAGRVREVLCQPGKLVEMGALLVRFDPPDDGETP